MGHQPIRKSRKMKISASVQALAAALVASGQVEPAQLLAVVVFMNSLHMLLISLEKIAKHIGVDSDVLDGTIELVAEIEDGLEGAAEDYPEGEF